MTTYRTTIHTTLTPDEPTVIEGMAAMLSPDTGELAIVDNEAGVDDIWNDGDWTSFTVTKVAS